MTSMGCTRDLFILALLVIFNFFHSFNAIDTITSTQFISDSKNESLVSSKGNFKLGFFSPGKSQNRYVGIWPKKMSKQTVVWVANRETPIKDSTGILKICEGNLAIFAYNGSSPLWSTKVPTSALTSIAKILDSGNLVLDAEDQWNNRNTIWQSFDYPTNAILPGMKFGMNRKTGLIHTLTSWKSSDDPASGEFFVALDPRGSPQLFLYQNSTPRWRCGPWNGRNLNGLPDVTTRQRMLNVVDNSNQVDLINYTFIHNDNEIYVAISTKNDTIFSICVLEPTGIVKRMIWHESKKWATFWMAPQDLCDEYARCGANAVCNEDIMMRCECLPGFEPLYPHDWNRECVETRKLDDCGRGDGEGFVRLESVKLPDARTSTVYGNMSINECENVCLKSCNCTGYASADVNENGRGCIIWYGELKDTRQYNDGQDFYLRVDAVEFATYVRKNSKDFLANISTIAFIIVPVIMELLLVAACFYYWWRKQAKKKGQKKKQRPHKKSHLDPATSLAKLKDSVSPSTKSSGESVNIELTFFDVRTIVAATDNFSPAKKLGRGGFGPVYKGQLPDGQEIAVKRLSNNSGQGIEEFENEVLLIAKLQHRNLVRLLGYCIEEEENMLIYEFMPNKSLDYFIFEDSRKLLLDWKKRFEIILGIARGILYLHEDSRLKIIHRDLKASNILLDGEMKPKISDFGTAKLFERDQTQANTNRVVGTFGYMSPEYVLGGLFSMKSDVFSFGVLLLEIISGRKNVELMFHDDPSSNLIRYTWKLWRDNKVLEIVDPCIADSCPAQEVMRCIQVGLLCVQDNARERPTMSAVIFMLSNETPLPSPKQSTFASRKPQTEPDSSITRPGSSMNDVTITTFSAR